MWLLWERFGDSSILPRRLRALFLSPGKKKPSQNLTLEVGGSAGAACKTVERPPASSPWLLTCCPSPPSAGASNSMPSSEPRLYIKPPQDSLTVTSLSPFCAHPHFLPQLLSPLSAVHSGKPSPQLSRRQTQHPSGCFAGVPPPPPPQAGLGLACWEPDLTPGPEPIGSLCSHSMEQVTPAHSTHRDILLKRFNFGGGGQRAVSLFWRRPSILPFSQNITATLKAPAPPAGNPWSGREARQGLVYCPFSTGCPLE